jgi:hypothetical protein
MENDLNLEELEGIDLDSETFYEVWAIGYDMSNRPTEFDYLLDSFSDPDAAITFADSVTVPIIREVEGDALVKADHFSVEVETTSVVDEEPMNLGTIYRRSIYYNSITADVMVSSGEYELQEDGSLKIPVSILEAFKDRDTIYIMFKDEANKPILPFKIIGEPDKNYFICDVVL